MTAPSGIGPVLITGCSSGLGDATARAFHEAGHLTVATARNVENLAGLKARGFVFTTVGAMLGGR